MISLLRHIEVKASSSLLIHVDRCHLSELQPGLSSAGQTGRKDRQVQADYGCQHSASVPNPAHRQRGIQAKLRQAEEPESAEVTIDCSSLDMEKPTDSGPRAGSVLTWARLIKRVYKVDPLECKCSRGMKIIIFIERGQCDGAERILHHCGLWEGPIRTLATARGSPSRPVRHTDQPRYEGCQIRVRH